MPQRASRSTPALVSLVVGTLILAIKATAWWFTDSAALGGDALESVVNVLAAALAWSMLRLGEAPADDDHPYGHGKAELFSAVFEGALVLLAGVWTAENAAAVLAAGTAPGKLDVGMTLAAAAAAANLALGAWLGRKGRELHSTALEADSKHVLSDVWTTVGSLAGLLVVWFTGWSWVDGAMGLALGAWMMFTGVRVVRGALDQLMDRADPELLRHIHEVFDKCPQDGITGIHRTRAIHAGEFVHVDAHVFVPGDWTVAQAHAAILELEEKLRRTGPPNWEWAFHLDPQPKPPQG